MYHVVVKFLEKIRLKSDRHAFQCMVRNSAYFQLDRERVQVIPRKGRAKGSTTAGIIKRVHDMILESR